MTKQKFNPITTLTINDEEIKARATFNFDMKAEKFTEEREDEKGKKRKSTRI